MLKIRDIFAISIAVLLAGCSSDDITTGGGLEVSSISDEWEIKPGDPVLFTTNISGKVGTRTVTYEPVGAGYTFTYFMYKLGDPNPIVGSTVYWPDINTNEYGFIAKTGTLETNGDFAALSADQDTEAELINEDQLLGYGAVFSDENKGIIHYRTAADWKNANSDVEGADKKMIRLYMQHRRAKITIILKAGTNVTSEDLASASVTIYSYPGSIAVDKPLHEIVGGFHQYTAIVEPHDYKTNSTDAIARISISGKTSYFYVSNENEEEKKINYNLEAGQHLTITITLTTN